MNFRNIKKFLQVSIFVVLVWLLVTRITWTEVWSHVTNADVKWLGIFIILYIIGIVIASYKWRMIAQWQHNQGDEKADLSLWFYVRTYVIGTFINNFLPSFIGGDAYRAWAHADADKVSDTKSLVHSTKVIIVDRITGLVSILLFAVLGISGVYLFGGEFSGALTQNIFCGLWIIIVVGFLFVYTSLQKKIIDYLAQAQSPKVRSVGVFIRELMEYRIARIAVPACFWGSVFALVGVASANYVLFLSLGVQMSLVPYMSVIFLISIIASLPLSVGNIGVKEWAYVVFFGLYGIDPAICVSVVLISRILQMGVSLIAAPLYMTSKRQ